VRKIIDKAAYFDVAIAPWLHMALVSYKTNLTPKVLVPPNWVIPSSNSSQFTIKTACMPFRETQYQRLPSPEVEEHTERSWIGRKISDYAEKVEC
jgi:hypothetical protein